MSTVVSGWKHPTFDYTFSRYKNRIVGKVFRLFHNALTIKPTHLFRDITHLVLIRSSACVAWMKRSGIQVKKAFVEGIPDYAKAASGLRGLQQRIIGCILCTKKAHC